MNALVVDCSYPKDKPEKARRKHYNLGAAKMANWLRAEGHIVTEAAGDPGHFGRYDLVALSVIFSWHAPAARDVALRVKSYADVWCGGPGMLTMRNWWQRETGLEIVKGLDERFERQPGNYRMVFASRGCPVGCYFCIVPKLEGLQQTLDWNFTPAPVLCDNNLSALPVAFQEHVIRRYQETGTRLVDANSGFEPRTFDEDTYLRWRGVLHGDWRFAFDEQREAVDVRRMMNILKAEAPGKKQVYVLLGNESLESCLDRALSVIAWGGEPYCQYVLPLNWLGNDATLHHRYDWNNVLRYDFQRYFNLHLWRKFPISRYFIRGGRPFAGTVLDTAAWEERWRAAVTDHLTYRRRPALTKPIVPTQAQLL